MTKYFVHAFRKGLYGYADSVGCFEVTSWEFRETGVLWIVPIPGRNGSTKVVDTFDEGSNYYIVANHGDCWEPNGEIIWRCESGKMRDEKAAA